MKRQERQHEFLARASAWKMSEVSMDARTFGSEFQPRFFNFVTGVILLVTIFIMLSWNMVLATSTIAKLLQLACSVTILASSAGLAVHCPS